MGKVKIYCLVVDDKIVERFATIQALECYAKLHNITDYEVKHEEVNIPTKENTNEN